MQSDSELLRDEPVPNSGDESRPPASLIAHEDSFSRFKDYLDEKLSSLKEEITEGTNQSTSTAVKKLKESEASFKFEGNKRQFKFNCSLSEQVTLAKEALKRKRSSKVDEALSELDKLIRKRNKLIRLADKSPAGWGLVDEYLSDELASGSEDEKRIKKAEQAALKKKSLKQKRPVKSFTRSQSQGFSGASSSNTSNAAFNPFSSRFTFQPTPRAKPTDICFACGLTGHWRANCRRRSLQTSQSSTKSQSSPAGGNQ